jgi:hypothetical protein
MMTQRGMEYAGHEAYVAKFWSKTLMEKITWRHVCSWDLRWVVEIGILKDVNWIKLTLI